MIVAVVDRKSIESVCPAAMREPWGFISRSSLVRAISAFAVGGLLIAFVAVVRTMAPLTLHAMSWLVAYLGMSLALMTVAGRMIRLRGRESPRAGAFIGTLCGGTIYVTAHFIVFSIRRRSDFDPSTLLVAAVIGGALTLLGATIVAASFKLANISPRTRLNFVISGVAFGTLSAAATIGVVVIWLLSIRDAQPLWDQTLLAIAFFAAAYFGGRGAHIQAEHQTFPPRRPRGATPRQIVLPPTDSANGDHRTIEPPSA